MRTIFPVLKQVLIVLWAIQVAALDNNPSGCHTDDWGSFSNLVISATTSPKTSASFASSSFFNDQSFFFVPFGQVDSSYDKKKKRQTALLGPSVLCALSVPPHHEAGGFWRGWSGVCATATTATATNSSKVGGD